MPLSCVRGSPPARMQEGIPPRSIFQTDHLTPHNENTLRKTINETALRLPRTARPVLDGGRGITRTVTPTRRPFCFHPRIDLR